jgi:hypothetical protein
MVKQGKPPQVTFMDKETVLAETDQTASKLVGIEYDFNYKQTARGYNHDEITFSAKEWDEMEVISLWDLTSPLTLKVAGIDNIRPSEAYLKAIGDLSDGSGVYVCVQCFYAGKAISQKKYTRCEPYSREPRFMQRLEIPDLKLCNLPKETRLCITVYGTKQYKDWDKSEAIPGKNDYALGWVNVQLFNYRGALKTGKVSLKLWPDAVANIIGTCQENVIPDEDPAILSLEFDEYSLPVVIPTSGTIPERFVKEQEEYEKVWKQKSKILSKNKLDETLDQIIKMDPVQSSVSMTDEERWRLWENRDLIKKNPKALPKFLLSVHWVNPYAVRLAHQYLEEWSPVAPLDALELLSSAFADEYVRGYAVRQIDTMEDNELSEFILQLVQTLKFENSHDSSVARFLLQRALRSTHLIGHILFWHLKAELHVHEIRERHGILLEEYLKLCGGHRRELLKQNGVIDQLLSIAMKIKKLKHKPKQDQLNLLRAEVQKLTLPTKFKLPLSPKMEVKGIIPEKCKVMDSAKLPLWLVFKNADESGGEDSVYVIFKAGDDLRQDLLTLQMLRIMDKLWRKRGLDLHMQPYGCISTGDGVGMIEVVLNSQTIANVIETHGGANACFAKEPIAKWLQEINPKKEYEKAQMNFVYSCAGYCVATFVLGIGDRHCDNIMCSRKGDLFHIDFGHFLGHFKTFAGLKRETSPFVFTPQYIEVMRTSIEPGLKDPKESPLFKKFLELSCEAYDVVRENGGLMMILFMLMLETGIPELVSLENDVGFLQKTLILSNTKEEASQHFIDQTMSALVNKRQLFSDYCHIVAHQKK